jgi:hypothetical protein
MKAKWQLCATLLSSVALIPPSAALAEYDLYNRDGTKWILNADLAAVGFLGNSWFGESDSFLGANTDSWLELGFEPQLSFETPLGKGTLFGKLSGVYTNTFGDDASGLTIGLDDTSDWTLEQGNIGWKISDLFSGLEDDTFSITLGNQDYLIGTGLLIADGGGDGGYRGGWYLGMRKAFKNSAVVRLASKELLAEAFYLENQPRSGGIEGDVTGGNLEYHFGDRLTLGGTYLLADANNVPGADTLDVYSGRADWRPLTGLTLSGEYVQQKSDQIKADGWYAQAAYEAKDLPWSPVFSYRYAWFDGDNPDTAVNENFRPIAYGYTDYGSWYQGEITGNYPLGNSNLISHMLRAKMQPSEKVTLNLIYYNFSLVEPSALAGDVAPVTSDDWGDEVDFIVDWQATEKIYVIGVAGVLFPGKAAEQWVGGNDNWLLGMLYASYAF